MGDPKIHSSSPSSGPYERLRGSEDAHESSRSKKWLLALSLAAVGLLAIAGVFGCCSRHAHEASVPAVAPDTWAHWQPVSRGPAEGVSEKTSGTSQLLRGADRDHPLRFSWTNTMLQWQRTAFHFQPEKNWMNDPNGPVYYKGWYHLFYQYNPHGAVWGNIVWGHSVSRDLVNWLHLPLAMVTDRWYDAGGVWTGSATVLPDGRLVMLYTGSTNASVQVQCLSVPADPSDPLLLHWIKSDANPVLLPPPGVAADDFRDPTTAWWDPEDAAWRIVIGSKDQNHAGISLVYRTTDFLSYELLPGVLHRVQRTGMWECVDFYPVATTAGANALDTSADAGAGVKHVLKASLDDDRNDYYALGSYNAREVKWTPDDPAADVGFGLRYDYGKFYASKTFYDHSKGRRLLWGWIGEADSEHIDILKGWASVQSIPRTVLYDNKTGTNLIQWPVEELESLRTSSETFNGIDVAPGSVHPLGVSSATELDIEAEFEIKASALGEVTEADAGYSCSTSGGAANRGALGPFGFLVLADGKLREQTAVYFYVSRSKDGGLRTHFCHDESRSSKANDVIKRVVGSTVPVLKREKLSVRILVDHSVVESFAQGGRTCITSRVYPTEAIYGAAQVFLFNNATSAQVTATSIKIWQMSTASFHRYSPQG